VIVAGRPSMGKSLAAKELLKRLAARGLPCGLVSIEENRKKIGRNMLSSESGIENRMLRSKRLTKDDWGRVTEAMPRLSKLPIYIDQQPQTLSQVIASATCMVSQYGCKVVAVDYLQLIDAELGGEYNEVAQVGHVSKELSRLRKRLDVTLVALAQLNRANESMSVRRPRLSDLRSSGQIEQDADVVILLHREDYYNRQKVDYPFDGCCEWIIAKARDAASGTVPMRFDEKTQRMSDWDGSLPDYLTNSSMN
jgi:replicative DNA helicase